MIYYERRFVFGIPKDIKPIHPKPNGKLRFRFRSNAVAKLFLRTESGIEEFIILDNGETWGLMLKNFNKRT